LRTTRCRNSLVRECTEKFTRQCTWKPNYKWQLKLSTQTNSNKYLNSNNAQSTKLTSSRPSKLVPTLWSILICLKLSITFISCINFVMGEHWINSCKKKDLFLKKERSFISDKWFKHSKCCQRIISCTEISSLTIFSCIMEWSNLVISVFVNLYKAPWKWPIQCWGHRFIWLLKF